MYLVLSSVKWLSSLLSINHSQIFANSLFRTFSISINVLMLIKYVKVVCIQVYIIFWHSLWNIFYIKESKKGQNIDPPATVYELCFLKYLGWWNEKSSACEVRMKPFSSSRKTLNSEVSKAFWKSIKIRPAYFLFSTPFKIMCANQDKHISVE